MTLLDWPIVPPLAAIAVGMGLFFIVANLRGGR